MAQTKFLDYSGTELLWEKIIKLINKKPDNIESYDDSITVTDGNKIAVKVSEAGNNLLEVVPGEGLYVHPSGQKLHKLTFGSNQDYVYDGSEDVYVPVYNGQVNE
jgi:hypothetical protein